MAAVQITTFVAEYWRYTLPESIFSLFPDLRNQNSSHTGLPHPALPRTHILQGLSLPTLPKKYPNFLFLPCSLPFQHHFYFCCFSGLGMSFRPIHKICDQFVPDAPFMPPWHHALFYFQPYLSAGFQIFASIGIAEIFCSNSRI